MADTNYQEEQTMELEALEAILMDDFQELQDDLPEGWDPGVKAYSVTINGVQEGEEVAEDGLDLAMELVFAHTPTYPDEPPMLKGRSLRGLSPGDVAEVQGIIDEQVEANMGMAMIYAIVAAVQEWLREKAAAAAPEPELDPEEAKKAAEEAEEARLQAARALGTPVTPDSFVAWKEKLTEAAASWRVRLTDNAAEKGRLTGKAYFLQQEATGAKEVEPESEDDDYFEAIAEEEDEQGDDEDDIDYEDDDDEGLLDEYLAQK